MWIAVGASFAANTSPFMLVTQNTLPQHAAAVTAERFPCRREKRSRKKAKETLTAFKIQKEKKGI